MDGLRKYPNSRLIWTLVSLLLISVFLFGINIRITEASNSRMLEVCKEDCRYTSIQAAIDAADSGDTVKLGIGPYRENLVINKDLTLKGAGQKKVAIKSAKERHPVVLIGPYDINVKVEGIKLIGAEGVLCADKEKGICPNGISITGSSQATIESSTISDNWEDGIKLWDSSQATITDSTISDNWSGIELVDSSQATITDNKITGNEVDGIWLSDSSQATITDNKITGNGWDGIRLESSSQAAVKGNMVCENGVGVRNHSDGKVDFQDNHIGDNTVDLVGNIDGTVRERLMEPSQKKITLPDDNYPTLQHAIDALLPGGTIVLEGKIKGGAVVDKELIIKASKEKVKLSLPEGAYAPVLSLINKADLKLSGVKITSPEGNGISIGGNAKLQVEESSITGNLYGITLWNSSQATITGSTISDNLNDGIELVESSQATITGSTISDNKKRGIGLFDSSQATITDNKITGNEYGIELEHSSQATIEGNEITNNEAYGICLYLKKCGFYFAPEKFKGKVEGRANQLSGNGTGPICPKELRCLMSEKGCEYPEK